MPNWCFNKIRITGNNIYQIKDLLRDHKSKVFSLTRVIHVPESDPNQTRIDKWGTKWDTSDDRIVLENKEEIEYIFDTAWSPPIPVIEALRKQFPKLYISAFFDEPAMEEAGYY
jgi:hypothetical protein